MKAGDHTQTQAQSNCIDYWNNNKASFIDPCVLFAYEIVAMSSNQGHYSITLKHAVFLENPVANSIRLINKLPLSEEKQLIF